jgi:hypothetical protein
MLFLESQLKLCLSRNPGTLRPVCHLVFTVAVVVLAWVTSRLEGVKDFGRP